MTITDEHDLKVNDYFWTRAGRKLQVIELGTDPDGGIVCKARRAITWGVESRLVTLRGEFFQQAGTKFYNEGLSELENQILDNVPDGQAVIETRALVAWRHRAGVEFGPLRWADRSESSEDDIFSVSPFPGAWTFVQRGDILRVRADLKM